MRPAIGSSTVAALMLAGCVTVEEPAPAVVEPAPPPVSAPQPKVAAAPKAAPKVEAPVSVEPAVSERQPAVAQRASDVDALLNEFQRLRKLTAADIPREQEAARLAFFQARTETARVRYAMTLALPGTNPADEARALEVLEPVVRNAAAVLNGLAVLLTAYVQEQRRLGAQVQALQQKLEALRVLERNLSERRK